MNNIRVIAFDADDTLWANESLYNETEASFCRIMEEYMPKDCVSRELLAIETKNIGAYGYGIKSFVLSMIETAIHISSHKLSAAKILEIIVLGKALIDKPVELINDVVDVLDTLDGSYMLVLATKGDLLDQEKKLVQSGLGKYFHHIEIVSHKNEKEYLKLIQHLDIKPDQFLMVGNSIKSDILPVLSIGAHAFHIPFHTTWAHESVNGEITHANFRSFKHLVDILPVLAPS